MKRNARMLLSTYRSSWKIRAGAVLLILTAWVVILSAGDSYTATSVFSALAGMLAFLKNTIHPVSLSIREKKCGILFATLFALAVTMANYRLFTSAGTFIYKGLILFAGGYLVAWHVLLCVTRLHIRTKPPAGSAASGAAKWFLSIFLGIVVMDLLVLFFCYRPGLLTPDSISQIGQNLSGSYSNHHPFWHTMIIRVVMDAGMTVFGDINSAVMVYSVFQILCMAAIFAYIGMTLYQMNVPSGWIMAVSIAYAVIPYHMLYSFTMWKDILFSGCVALFVCVLFRMQKNIGGNPANCIILAISALGCCLLRSNGLAAFALTWIALAFILKKAGKRILAIMLSAMVIAFIMKHPVLKMLQVDQPDAAEFLSIPEQQIARLIADDASLEDDELLQISRIMDPEAVKREYKPHISDPVKDIVRQTGLDYLSEHKQDYLMLWLKLGIRHPDLYLKAWIDQTRGYWHGGYRYWIVAPGVHHNHFGIEAYPQNNIFFTIVNGWSYLFLFDFPVFQIFTSIGLHVWMVVLLGAVCVIRRRREGLLCVLPLAVILSLLISTPVFSEFRYAYAIFTSFPFIALSVLSADGTAPDESAGAGKGKETLYG